MAKEKKKSETETRSDLFDQFGEMGSAKELNICADGFREEGDIESLKALAVENGFTEEDALSYAKDREEHLDVEFCNPISAAIAKLDLETDHGANEQAAELLKSELDDMELTAGIRKKGKRLKKAFKKVEEYARSHKTGNCGAVSDGKALEIMKEYYKGA